MSKKQLATLFLCSLVIWIIGNGLLPLLPVYASKLGASFELTGYYLSFSYLALVAGTIAGGWLSDKLDRRKLLLIAAGVVMAPVVGLMGLATSVWQLAVLTAIVWFLGGLMLVEISILAGLFAGETERGKVFGILTSTGGLGGLIGGLATGPIADRWGYPPLFVALALLCVLSPLIALVLQDKRLERARPEEAMAAKGSAGLPALFLLFLAANALAYVANFGSLLGRLLEMNELGFASAAISATASVNGIVTLAGALVIGPLSDRLGRRGLLAMCYLSTTASLLVLGVATTLWQFYLAGALQAMAVSGRAIGRALAADLVPRESLGQGMAFFEASPWLGGVLGYGGMGSAVQNLGMATAVILGALLSLLATVLLVPVRRARREEERPVVVA